MEKFLQNIQNKPEHIRWRILYITLFISMALVVSIWILTIRGYILPQKEVPIQEAKETSSSPFKILKDSGSVLFGDFVGGIKEIKSNVSE